MNELRWNPLLGTWTMVAANRQTRPHLPTESCPFCPKNPEEHYTVKSYPNDFPALSPKYLRKLDPAPAPYANQAAYGFCEVILYDSAHTKHLWQLPLSQVEDLVRLWYNRFSYFATDEKIKYIFIFENRGEPVGVTIHHPHGQLYAYPFVPLKLATELANCQNYYQTKGQCLICAMNETERNDIRLIFANAHFLVYLPYFTDYPYGVWISARRHFADFKNMNELEKKSLAEAILKVNGMFDFLFDKPFPFMMCLHPAPVNCPEYIGLDNYFHFHIEFYPPLRMADKIKYYASSEMGAWAAANTRLVEETAQELRDALQKFESWQSTQIHKSF